MYAVPARAAFFALLEGIVYFIIGTKVKKPGAILIYSIVRAIMGGYLPYIILFILSGAIAELLLWKIGYGNAKALTISYVINQVLAAFPENCVNKKQQAALAARSSEADRKLQQWVAQQSLAELCRRTGNC